jgi:TolB-like protein/class 3 adenylate cyclase/tetratricopeptide (TPR) repeat protein
MTENGQTRRLAAILAADVVGYSRLMGLDEAGTLAALRAILDEIVKPTLEAHNGRLVKLMGDGALAEFGSVVDAVTCAVAIQAAMAERENNAPEATRIQFRIGINLGDIIIEDDDIFGDGVNLAARLEGIADPGGICVSRTVVTHVGEKAGVEFQPMGPQLVKNIAEPVEAFRVAAIGAKPALKRRKPRRRTAMAALALVAIAAATGWFAIDPGAGGPSEPVELALTDMPSVAVLPFEDLSESPQVWFGDGMAEDIITDLSKLSGLFVIARNSSFQYRGGGHDLREVGRSLGVAYLLEGSVRRAGDQLRINAQLIDAQTGGHLWAERYDGEAGDVFALQDRVTSLVVESLRVALTERESAAMGEVATSSREAHDAYLQGLGHLYRRTPEDYTLAKRWFDRALTLDPTHAQALGGRATLLIDASQRGWYGAVGLRSQRTDLITAVETALEHPSPGAYAAEADLLLTKPDADGAAAAVERGLALDPNDADLHVMAAYAASAQGDLARAEQMIQRAMRLNPRYPPLYLKARGWLRFLAGDLEGAIEFYDRAVKLNPEDWGINVERAAALAEAGRQDEAAADLAVAREHWPPEWGSQFYAGPLSWFWGRGGGVALVTRLRSAFLAAGASGSPEGYDLKPEDRLTREERLPELWEGSKVRGRCCGGLVWTSVLGRNGEVQEFWNDVLAREGTLNLLADGSAVMHFRHRLMPDQYCSVYRNPGGSNEALDAFLSVCAHGVFPWGILPPAE